MKPISVPVLAVCLLTARTGAANVTSSFGTADVLKNRREAIKVLLPSQAGEPESEQANGDDVVGYYTDDSYTGYSGLRWQIGSRAAEYSLQAGKTAKQLKVLAYRRGYKLIARTFDVSGGKTHTWKLVFEKLPVVQMRVHLTDGAGAAVRNEKLQIGFEPNFDSYPYGDSKSSMGLQLGTFWALSNGQTDENGNVALFVADLSQDKAWLDNQKFDNELIIGRAELPQRSRWQFNPASYAYDDRVYLSEPITAQRMKYAKPIEVRRLFLTPLKIEVAQKFLDRKKWTKEMLAPSRNKSGDKERYYISLVPHFVFDRPVSNQTRYFYQRFPGLSLTRKSGNKTGSRVDYIEDEVDPGDATIPLSFIGKVIPGTYEIEAQVTRYAPAPNGMISMTFVSRETIARNIVVTENTPRVFRLE